MKVSIKDLFGLSMAETTFIFKMMRKYGGLEHPTTENNGTKRKNGNRNRNTKPVKGSDPNFPNLFDFSCEKWNTCTDGKFLQYRSIMEKVSKE